MVVVPATLHKPQPKGRRLRLIAEQAVTLSLHPHMLPRTRLDHLVIQGPDGAPVYRFGGNGAYVCRVCAQLKYHMAHHCAVCIPSFDICEPCFQRQKALEIGSKFINKGVAFDEQQVVEYRDSSSEDDDPFGHFGQAKPPPASVAILQACKQHDFEQLLEVLFPKQQQEDLTAEAQGIENALSRLDFSIRDDATGRTMLHFAAEAGNDRVCLGLRMHIGAEVRDLQDHQGLTALMIASIRGEASVVEELLYFEADTSIKCSKGYTALMLAVSYGHADVTSRLLFKGSKVNVRSSRGGRTALAIAALNGQTECVKRMLQYDEIDKSLRDDEGYTPLLLAASRGHQDIVALFPEHEKQRIRW